MYITIDNKKYEQLKLVSHLTAQQLFFQQDYIQLAQAIQANQDIEENMKKIVENFQNYMHLNNTIIKLLMDLNVLGKPMEKQQEEENTSPDNELEPTPPTNKPTLKIVR